MPLENKKKLMVVLSVVCLGVAGAIAALSLRGSVGGIESLESGVIYLMKCRACDN